MKISLIQISPTYHINNNELFVRAEESTKSPKTVHYIVSFDSEEVAFVSIDRWPELAHLVLYEMYIATSYRRRGYAKQILSIVEKLAQDEGYTYVRLKPHPLDGSISRADLINLYLNSGYLPDPEVPGDMIKEL